MMYSPGFTALPAAAGEAVALLREVLMRCAAAGRLRVDVDQAAQTIMSANIGVALSMVSQPGMYADPELSDRVRDAVHRAVLDLGALPEPDPADAVPAAGRQLGALLHTHDVPLTGPEKALLLQWLDTLGARRPDR